MTNINNNGYNDSITYVSADVDIVRQVVPDIDIYLTIAARSRIAAEERIKETSIEQNIDH
tara:strand:+ start:27 stop:206 length:180 start_codon:yes stop_codon:yes gene_type:complete